MGGSRRGLALVVLAGVLAGTVLGGCQQLFGMGGLPLYSRCDSSSTPPTTYARGTATLAFSTSDPGTVALGTLDGSGFPSMYDPACSGSASAEWTDASGDWTLTLITAVGISGPMAAINGLYLENGSGPGGPGLYADGTSCTITTTEASASGLVGHATCMGLRWISADEQASSPAPAPDHPPFDVTITFEARP